MQTGCVKHFMNGARQQPAAEWLTATDPRIHRMNGSHRSEPRFWFISTRALTSASVPKTDFRAVRLPGRDPFAPRHLPQSGAFLTCLHQTSRYHQLVALRRTPKTPKSVCIRSCWESVAKTHKHTGTNLILLLLCHLGGGLLLFSGSSSP